MKKIYAPWRSKYTKGLHKTKEEKIAKGACVFCTQFSDREDDKHFILKRYKHCVIMMNLYPYNAGHLMVLPITHKSSLNDLTKEVRSELIELTNLSVNTLKKAFSPAGFNVGMNLGKASGAGIPSHLHIHIVPRWEGDTNFLPVIGDTKAISFDLQDIFQGLKKAL